MPDNNLLSGFLILWMQTFTLSNKNGITAYFTNYGGILTHLWTPDRNGELADIVLGYDKAEAYRHNPAYFGAIIGRYANRIANGRFTIDDTNYQLATNNNTNHIHGGINGFHKVLWTVEQTPTDKAQILKLSHFSPDGTEGYPGNLHTVVTYSLTNENVLRIDYEAISDKATHLNLTSHSYFNLKGEGNGDVLKHYLQIHADFYTPVLPNQIPIGILETVHNTPFDFRAPKPIGQDINVAHPQVNIGNTYDHNFVISGKYGELRLAAYVNEPENGRTLTTYTTEPGVQLYVNNFSLSGKGGKTYTPYTAFCLETQHFPDSPNQTQFPTTLLKPSNLYRSVTEYHFGIG